MRRRIFLKHSAIGVGTLAGICGGALKLEGEAPDRLVQKAKDSDDRDRATVVGGESQHVWGINSAVLRSPWSAAPSLSDMFADREHTLILDTFYRAGGDNRQATPTECYVSYTNEFFLVGFRCQENSAPLPYASLDGNLWPEADWYSLQGLPSGATSNWSPYPDEVDVLIQPDMDVPSYYHFAATLQGLKFGCKRVLDHSVDATADKAATARNSTAQVNKLDAFEISVAKEANEWSAFFRIPWQTLGGKPKHSFGFLPMRTRWREGEFSSPVAVDFDESLPVDLLIEMHFSSAGHVLDSHSALCRLPSGMLRWQRPAILTYPEIETCHHIWQLESSLTIPTNEHNLAERLYLTQRWMDLMMLEGFTPLPRAWGILSCDLTLAPVRQTVNAAFHANDVKKACMLLDTYLNKLDQMSRWWYADGSPGDILEDDWNRITGMQNLEVQENALLMRCVAGGRPVDLHLALPTTGGIRIYGADQGYWRPSGLLPLMATQTSGEVSIQTAGGRIVVRRNPLEISFLDAAGKTVVRIGGNDLAFRFSSDGEILAVDFRNQLDSDEVIYGFGEKYDHFNKRGTVLTLWGTDDWVGNGKGLANTTYKPLPIFHSSKGYMVFDNSSYRLRADIGKTDPSQYRLTQFGPIFDYYFWVDSPENALRSYTALTGRPPLPPKWAFEPWMGRGGGAWASGKLHNAVAEQESAAERFADLDIPHSAIYAEGPSALSPQLNQFMAARGIRVLGYFMPEIGLSGEKLLMPELNDEQLPIVQCGTKSQTRALGYIDFTNPNAQELCRRALKRALDLGEAGSMVDYGDLVPDDAVFYDGQRGAEMHNLYYYDYQRTISEVFQEHRGTDFILYARGAAPGTQRWVGQFAGDHPANFDGLRHVLTGALNLCACGYSNWGSDLGGYFGFPQPAVYMRWIQFGCFSPLMRPHGTAPREPWYFGEGAVTNYKFLAWTRENLLNYIHNAASIAHETGVPIMRSMPVAFPDESQVAAVGDHYMFGPDLLVAPVLNEATSRVISFPSGSWVSLWDGKTISGPSKTRVDAPLDTIPVYLRPGAVVPARLNQELQFGGSMTAGSVYALTVTPPLRSEDVSLLNVRGETAGVKLRLLTDGFSWKIQDLPEISCLLVYGLTSASIVRVNGKTLPKLTLVDDHSMQSGWKVDLACRRLIISLPSKQVEQSEPITEVEVSR